MNGFYGVFNFSGNPSCGFDAGAFNNGLNQYLESVKAQLMQQYAPPPQQQNPYAAIDARVENYMTQNGYPPRQQVQQQEAALSATQEQQQNPMQLVTMAISESVSAADMALIAANFAQVLDWLRTAEGKKLCSRQRTE